MAKVLPSDVAGRIQSKYRWVSGSGAPKVATTSDTTAITAILALVELVPESLLRLSPTDYGDFIWSVASLQCLPEVLESASSPNGRPWPKVENVDAMTTLWQLLKKCPEEGISEQTAGLPFIKDESLRDSIRLDISSAESAFNNGEWKAATVLAAAAVEALLLWSLNQRSEAERQSAIQKRNLKLNAARPEERDWNLSSYIAVATELGHIKPETTTQAGLAKDFRNLIHPGRETRLKQKCDRGTARSALAALDHVAHDLESRFGRGSVS
jgi:hypothetical protein